MDEFDQLLSDPQPQQPIFQKRVLAFPSKSSNIKLTDWLDDNKWVIGLSAVVAIALISAIPNYQANRKNSEQLASTLRPALAETQKQAALSVLAAQQNQIAEQRYADPNCVAVRAVISGERAHRLGDGVVVSAGATVCDLAGSTGIVKPHPTGKFDLVTGRELMRPIVDRVSTSNGENYQQFVKRFK